MGDIFDSRFRSGHPVSITGRTKILDSRDVYPGPGSYKCFSEFGSFKGGKNYRSKSVPRYSKTNNESKG